MKKLAIAFSFLFVAGNILHAQDLKKARTAVTLLLLKPDKLEDAKMEVDKLFTSDKTSNDAESYLLKMEIYSALAVNEALSPKYPGAEMEAYDALKKYLELEPNEDKLKKDNYVGVNGIYTTLFKEGIKYYNVKAWDSAYNKFKNLATFGDMLIEKKWSTAAFDTTSHLYAAATAQNALLEKEAVYHYSKLADIKVSGKDYEGVYEYLTKFYLNNPNDEKFQKYTAIAKEVYPANTLWSEIEFEYTKKNSKLDDFVKKFEAADAAGNLTAEEYTDYGNVFASDERVRDLPEDQKKPYNEKAFYAFKKAYGKDSTNGIAAYNAAVTAYSTFQVSADSASAVKGVTAEIKARKAVVNKQAIADADVAANWLDKAFNSLAAKTTRSGQEKGLLNKSLDLLYNVYEYKRDMSRGVNPKEYDLYEKKLNDLNALHDKFK